MAFERKNYGAFTTSWIEDHVDYISINSEEDGRISIAVRENGTHATVYLSETEWEKLKREIAGS